MYLELTLPKLKKGACAHMLWDGAEHVKGTLDEISATLFAEQQLPIYTAICILIVLCGW
jgi:hypothetical protein